MSTPLTGSQLPIAGVSNEPYEDPLDLMDEIDALKQQKNAVILAHYYVGSEIQDIADYNGDSLKLARDAASVDNPIIVFAGVHFMAESAKILSPEKKVLIPDPLADFSKYRGFNWLPPTGSEVELYDTRIKRFVALDLTQRGYLQGGAPPALLISYGLDLPSDKGTLTLEMVDSESKRFVWNAATQVDWPVGLPPAEMDKRVQQSVKSLLPYFPGPSVGK